MITEEQLKDLGWALTFARGWAAIHANDEQTEARLDSAEAGLKVLMVGEQERAAPKAYADACSDRGQQTSPYGGARGGGKRAPISFEEDIKSKDW